MNYLMKIARKPQVNKEHVLIKPQQYIGSLQQVEDEMWVIQKQKMVLKKIPFVSGLFKLIDEILINAAQNKIADPSMSFITIVVKQTGTISVTNDGKTIPKEQIGQNKYLTYAIFGQSEDYYPRGYSVKLVNIFSKSFYVETGHSEEGIAMKLVWKNNMEVVQEPAIVEYKNRDYTKIGFTLDMEKLFGKNKKISSGMMSLLERRAYDIAGLLRVKVTFNGKAISFNNFVEYTKLYVKDESHIFYDRVEACPRWNVVLGKSQNGYQQLSFVNNSVWTRRGGTHVNVVMQQIATKALQIHSKRLRDPTQVHRKPQKFRSNYMIFVSVYAQEPEFQNRIKDKLTSPCSKLQTNYIMSYQALSFLDKNQLLQNFKEITKIRENKKTNLNNKKETVKSRVMLPSKNLEDAANAGISSRCTLVIAENEAIKNLMAAGLESSNRDYFGIYFLVTKLPNARQLSTRQIAQNQDFSGISKALGLSLGKKYESFDILRYSTVLIVTDNDISGISIKGLLLNFFETYWAPLCKIRGFLKFLLLPMVICTNLQGNTKHFITEQHLKQSSIKNAKKDWSITSYAGLGNMTIVKIKELMINFKRWVFSLVYKNQGDEQSLKIFYSRKYVQKKRKMLEDYRLNNLLNIDFQQRQITVKDFVERELIRICYYQQHLATPSCYDGLLISQRKALHCLFQNGQKQIKLTQVMGLVQKTTNFDFTQKYLQNSLIKMGQAFVGGNNLALIEPFGQFGSRYYNGKDSSHIRYLSTTLPALTALMFPEDDFPILQYEQSENAEAPKYYLPILPLILINGCSSYSGIWNSVIFAHKISDVIEIVKARIQKSNKAIIPNWQRFRGTIEVERKGYYYVKGSFQLKGKYVKINEISPTKSLKQYKNFLQEYLPAQNKEGFLQSIKQNHKEDCVEFVIKFQEGKLPPSSDLDSFLKLESHLVQNNMIVLDQQGKFKKYENVSDLLEDYYDARLKAYQRRKEYLICKKIVAIQQLQHKIRFIKDVLSGQFNFGESEEIWKAKFLKKGYKKYQQFFRKKPNMQNLLQVNKHKDFEYLCKINLQDISQKKLKQLKGEKQQFEQKLTLLKKTDEKELWLKDITLFQQAWRISLLKKNEIETETNKRVTKAYKQPSEPSLKRKPKVAEFSDISLDSLQRAELQRSKTVRMQEDNQDLNQRKPKANPKNNDGVRTQSNKNGDRMDLKKFSLMITSMQRHNIQFKKKMKSGSQGRDYRDYDVDRNSSHKWDKQLDKVKKDKQIEDKKHQNGEQYKKNEVPKQNHANLKKEAKQKRDALGRHAQEIGRKVEQDLKKQREEHQRSQKSDRNHLPKPKRETPKITVPYEYHGFNVNHVQRKRFSSKGVKIDEKQIRDIEESLKRVDQEENNKKATQCINLDD